MVQAGSEPMGSAPAMRMCFRLGLDLSVPESLEEKHFSRIVCTLKWCVSLRIMVQRSGCCFVLGSD